MIFSSTFLHAVTFSHVLHLDVLRRQIELKLKAKIEISLCMAIMQNHPLPSLYTQYYRTYRLTPGSEAVLDIPEAVYYTARAVADLGFEKGGFSLWAKPRPP